MPSTVFTTQMETTVLKAEKKLGYSDLRENQVQIVQHFLSGKDVCVSLPTTSGKSLCYCVLPYTFDLLSGVSGKSIVIVVSPLVSLMIHQVRHMCERNIIAV